MCSDSRPGKCIVRQLYNAVPSSINMQVTVRNTQYSLSVFTIRINRRIMPQYDAYSPILTNNMSNGRLRGNLSVFSGG